MTRPVTERDFRKYEFYDAKPEDYEFREDGKIVRKDRWETAIRSIASLFGMARTHFEIDEIVAHVDQALTDANRYRFLRNSQNNPERDSETDEYGDLSKKGTILNIMVVDGIGSASAPHPEELDAIVDAAIDSYD